MVSQQPFFPVELLLHTLFRNRYFILSQVGAGGFGSVYKASDTQSGDRLVAIKEVNLLGLHSQAMIEATTAFQREVSLLSQLDHPNLPRLYEYFQNPGHWYLVMDFIAGETLEEYQSKAPKRRLLLSEVLDIGIQLCIVLDYLHSQQPSIVFRDLKPANIMRTPTGQIYLIDFGIARHFKPGQAKDTVALGSLGYAAPEQYGKAQTTPRADIYSLGAVLHQLLT
ncbi:MAG TPA: serine/threonine-protein kinase, partial [Ktedonobacteraceae bacterium]